jgi:hypothetical protein
VTGRPRAAGYTAPEAAAAAAGYTAPEATATAAGLTAGAPS